MKEVRKITYSAMAVALSLVVMFLGSLIEVMDLTVAAIASLLMVFIYIEVGKPYTFLVWLATSLAAFLLFPYSAVGLEYLLLFGVYPILKGTIERLPKPAWLPVRLVWFNAVLLLCAFVMEKLLLIPFFDGGSRLMNILLFLLFNVAFIVYDFFLTVAVRLYFARFRDRIKKYFIR